MWASVQTIRGCPKHCSFCSVWRTDGQKPRQRKFQSVVDEIIALRRLGFRFIALADDNFYPVTFTDLRLAREQNNTAKVEELTAIRAERFALMEELAKLPRDMVFYTQMTMEAGEDGEYLDAMKRANIKGALVGVEAVTPEGLKAVYKDWNYSGEALAKQLQTFKAHGVHVLGSFIFGLPTDKPATFDATVNMAIKAGVTFAQFVMMTPFPGTVDFGKWEKEQAAHPTMVGDVPLTRYWLIPTEVRPKMFTPHPTMSSDEIRERTQKVWDRFYNWRLDLGAFGLHAHAEGANRVHVPVEALPADVCGNGHLDGQRAAQEVEALGAVDGGAVQAVVPRQANAGARKPEVGFGFAGAGAGGVWSRWRAVRGASGEPGRRLADSQKAVREMGAPGPGIGSGAFVFRARAGILTLH